MYCIALVLCFEKRNDHISIFPIFSMKNAHISASINALRRDVSHSVYFMHTIDKNALTFIFGLLCKFELKILPLHFDKINCGPMRNSNSGKKAYSKHVSFLFPTVKMKENHSPPAALQTKLTLFGQTQKLCHLSSLLSQSNIKRVHTTPRA